MTNIRMQLLHMLHCYDRLSSEHVLVITSCTTLAQSRFINIHKLHPLPKKWLGLCRFSAQWNRLR